MIIYRLQIRNKGNEKNKRKHIFFLEIFLQSLYSVICRKMFFNQFDNFSLYLMYKEKLILQLQICLKI